MAGTGSGWVGHAKAPQMTVLSDHPTTGREDCLDSLRLETRLSAVYDILRHKHTRCPITVGIYGDWGTGKTSAMRWLETQLKEWNRILPEYREGHPRVHPVWFDPWRFQTRDEVWRGIIAEVILSLFAVRQLAQEDFSKRLREAAKQFGSFLGRGFLHALANVEVTVGSKDVAQVKLSGEAFRDIYEEYEKSTHPAKAHLNHFEATLRSWIEHFLKKGKDGYDERLVIFIDDLDRCMPAVTLEVLEALKLYLNIEPLVFVVGLDRAVVDGIVQKHYREHGVAELKSREYLNKLFQIEIQIPPSETQMEEYLQKQIQAIDVSTSGYWSAMLGKPGESNREHIEKSVEQLSRHNPREVKRLLNSALLLGRSAADRKPEQKTAENFSRLRFAQGVQFFLLQWLVNARVSESAKLLLKRDHLEWFDRFSQFARAHQDFKPSTQIFAQLIPAAERVATSSDEPGESASTLTANERASLRELLESRPLNDEGRPLEFAFLANETLWRLVLIPFSVEVAEFAPRSAALTRSSAPSLDKSATSPIVQLAELTSVVRDGIAAGLGKPVNEITSSDLAQLKHLALNYTDTNDADIASLCKITGLTQLYLRNTKITNAALKDISKLTALQILWFDSTAVNDEILPELIKLTSLRSLSFTATQITDNALKELIKLTSLQKLWLDRTSVTDAGTASLNELPALAEIWLGDTAIGDATIDTLVKLKSLRRVAVQGTRITKAGIQKLMRLSELSGLEIGSHEITDDTLVDLHNLKKLETLSLRESAITDASMREISRLPALQTLTVSSPGITDIGVKELAATKTLRSLSLTSTAVTDRSLEEMLHFPQLSQLVVNRSKITNAGIHRFKAKRKDVHISVHSM